jgi:hypothetical protein
MPERENAQFDLLRADFSRAQGERENSPGRCVIDRCVSVSSASCRVG